jgi:hypothetical protein
MAGVVRVAAVLVLLACSACGYAFTAGVGRLPAGAEQVAVRPLGNRTGDAEAGALLAGALRAELARRGADGGPSAPARLEGEVEEIASAPAGAGMWRLTLVVQARLSGARGTLAEHRARRTEDYLAGVDPLETEGRRRIALGRAAAAAAREIVERMEAP